MWRLLFCVILAGCAMENGGFYDDMLKEALTAHRDSADDGGQAMLRG